MGWAKLYVRFTTLLCTDLEEIKNVVSKVYTLSYVGKYVHEGKSRLYIQTSATNVKMAPIKLQKILQAYGDVEFIGTFQDIEGMLDEEVGEMRTRARRPNVKNISQSNNTIRGNHNTLSMDNSVTINLHVHAFGNEDVSHITTAQMDEWVGKKEHIVESVTTKLGVYLTNELRRIVYESKHEEKMDDWEASPPEARREEDRPEFKGEDALMDPDVEDLLSERIVKTRAGDMKKTIVADFARLLYQNPHNANVSVDKKSGHFKIFDGHKWHQYEMSLLCQIILENLLEKSRETVEGLNLPDANFTKSFIEYLDHIWTDKKGEDEEKRRDRDARRRLSDNISTCVDNEISSIKENTGRKIRRVNTGASECRNDHFRGRSSWK